MCLICMAELLVPVGIHPDGFSLLIGAQVCRARLDWGVSNEADPSLWGGASGCEAAQCLLLRRSAASIVKPAF